MAAKVNRDPRTIDFSFYESVHISKPPHKTKFSADPIWTKYKAKLIEKYLAQFIQVTHHGTYIDGFAGPQRENGPEMWCAKLVLEITPRWLRNFYLFDIKNSAVAELRALRDDQPLPDKEKREPKRSIVVDQGDANTLIRHLLKTNTIRQREATFCLLDQRNIECEWATLTALSGYKKVPPKIEILYFLPSAWLNRALINRRDKSRTQKWWGREDWKSVERMSSANRMELFKERFRNELGYEWVEAWPIFKNNSRSQIMYYMIHATDHKVAPYLMQRAYRKALGPAESVEEIQIDIENYLIEVSNKKKPASFSIGPGSSQSEQKLRKCL
jgi:three-Cys-motif partner protein